MDVRIQNFLGREIVLPKDRSYDPEEGLWIQKQEDGRLAIGMTEPAVLMAGSIREMEFLVEDGIRVDAGEAVLLALTSKLKYLAVPFSGKLIFPEGASPLPARVNMKPYGTPLFYLIPEDDQVSGLVDAAGYAAVLRESEGSRNPGGHRGGVSPTCKAVYMGIGEQTLQVEPQSGRPR
jgi:glycine cleavage system H lipoate-binding protein